MRFVSRSTPSVLSSAALLGLLASLLVGPAQGQSRSAPPAPVPSRLAAASVTEPGPPAQLAATAVEPLARLVEAQEGAADRVEALAAWNRAGRLPLRVGIVRELALPRAVRFGEDLARSPAGLHAGGAFARVGADATAWGASVRVEEAHRLRLVLEDVSLPAETRIWVYGQDGEAVSFGPELAHEGTLWTPSVFGPEIRLEVELDRDALISGGGHGFSVAGVAEIFRLDAAGAPILEAGVVAKDHDDCLIDVSCRDASDFPVIEEASTAIASIEFIDGPFFKACTGGLLNLATGAPEGLTFPFLTANHCLSSHQSAATVEAFWDFRTDGCDGPPPASGGPETTNGATLLATGGESDFTLLALDEFPSGERFVLGWNAESPTLPKDTELFRISHPAPHQGEPVQPQRYTKYRMLGPDEVLSGCGTTEVGGNADDPTQFHHTVFLEGGTFGGSSGAPLMLSNGQVVGQLFGVCGPDETRADGCSKENDELDGNFYTTFDFVAPFLGVMDEEEWLTTPELPGFEFQVVITGAEPVTAQAESDCITETLCVSGALAGRPEVFVKVIGPRPNGFLWVQISRFTPSRVDVRVRQLSTGEVNQYTLPAVPGSSDDVSGLQDRQAFSP